MKIMQEVPMIKWDSTDISANLLNQLNRNHSEFLRSRICSTQGETCCSLRISEDNGLINQDGYYAFSEDYEKVFEHHYEDSLPGKKLKKEAELYFQVAFQNYLDL